MGITWELLEMQILGPSPDLMNEKLWGWSLALCFTSPTADSDNLLTFENHWCR